MGPESELSLSYHKLSLSFAITRDRKTPSTYREDTKQAHTREDQLVQELWRKHSPYEEVVAEDDRDEAAHREAADPHRRVHTGGR